jgi:ribosomal protein S25
VTPIKLLRTGLARNFKLERDTGAPKTVITKENIDLVHDMVLTDRRVTVRFIAKRYGFSIGIPTVEKILRDQLGLKKIWTRWVPKMLTARETCHR